MRAGWVRSRRGRGCRSAGRGFTLMELLVVVVILGVVSALLMPALGRAKESARATVCLGNLRQLGLALQMYADANDRRLPIMRDVASGDVNEGAAETGVRPEDPPVPARVEVVLGGELGGTQVLRCPSDRGGWYERTGSSYSWNSLLNGQRTEDLRVLGMRFEASAIPVMFDKEGFHAARGPARAVNYLYADGHLKNLLVVEGVLDRP